MRTETAIILLIAGTVSMTMAQGSSFKAAYERANEVFVTDSEGKTFQVTDDGVPKDLPLFSQDGTRLAFIQKSSGDQSLVKMRIVDANNGTEIASFPVRPKSKEKVNDLRFVDRLRWLSSEKVVASGSINPTTEESIILDTKTGEELDSIYDDNGGAVFSPNGTHVAYVTGSPHFLPEAARKPVVNIDNRQVYPKDTRKIELISNIAWSDNNEDISFVISGSPTTSEVVVCSLIDRCENFGVPVSVSRFTIQWSGSSILLNAREGSWSVDTKSRQFSKLVPSPSNEVPFALEGALRQAIQKQHGRSVDVWCDNCALRFNRETRAN